MIQSGWDLQLRCVFWNAMSIYQRRRWWVAPSSAQPTNSQSPHFETWGSTRKMWWSSDLRPGRVVVKFQGNCNDWCSSQLGAMRLLMTRVAPLFTAKGLEFKVEYINNTRDWNTGLPKISTLYGAYRRRSVRDTEIVPHSFTFIRRESTFTWNWLQP